MTEIETKTSKSAKPGCPTYLELAGPVRKGLPLAVAEARPDVFGRARYPLDVRNGAPVARSRQNTGFGGANASPSRPCAQIVGLAIVLC